MKLGCVPELILFVCACSLSSCSGVKNCSTNCGGNNNATINVELTATPQTPPPAISILAFSVDVAGVSLTPATGSAVNITLNTGSNTYALDLMRLQSDSAFVGQSTTVAAPSTFNTVTISFTAPTVTYCTLAASGKGCAAGSIAQFTGNAAAPAIATTVTVSANQQIALAINVDLSKVLTVQNQAVTGVDLTTSNAVTVKTLPPTTSSLPANSLDFIEDVTGAITAVNSGSQSVTVQTATRGPIQAIANNSTVFSPNCTSFNLSLDFSHCVVQGHVASLDTVLNPDGTFTLLEYDPLATSTGDWVEGTVTSIPTSSTQFQIVVNDEVLATAGSLVGNNLPLGSTVNVTFSGTTPFAVDTKGFNIVGASTFGGTDTSVLLPAQTVSVHVKNFTAAVGATPAAITVDTLYLRFTRVAGTISTVVPLSNNFSIQSLPPFFGLVSPVNVQMFSGTPSTNFDGVTSAGDSNFSSGSTVSIRAIYLDSTKTTFPFNAAKVRIP